MPSVLSAGAALYFLAGLALWLCLGRYILSLELILLLEGLQAQAHEGAFALLTDAIGPRRAPCGPAARDTNPPPPAAPPAAAPAPPVSMPLSRRRPAAAGSMMRGTSADKIGAPPIRIVSSAGVVLV
jgi:hypothetical protein